MAQTLLLAHATLLQLITTSRTRRSEEVKERAKTSAMLRKVTPLHVEVSTGDMGCNTATSH
jgi:hypothetical protein